MKVAPVQALVQFVGVILGSLILVFAARAQNITYTCDAQQNFTLTTDAIAATPPDRITWAQPQTPNYQFTAPDQTQRLQMIFPFSTPTAFIVNNPSVNPAPKLQAVQSLIRTSVLANVDPYLALAVGLHEGGTTQIDTFYGYFHDHPLFDALGCRNRLPRAQGPEIVDLRHPADLQRFLEADRRGATRPGQSFFCVGRGARIPANIGEYTLSQTPLNEYACCARIPFGIETARYQGAYQDPNSECTRRGSFGHIPCQLTQNFLQLQTLRRIAADPTYQPVPARLEQRLRDLPEYRIQTILGNSISTGTGAPRQLAPWRLGSNSFATPVYGLTVLDFYVLSLASHPVVRRQVELTERALGVRPAKLLCYQKSVSTPVAHTYPMRRAIDWIAKTPRFTAILAKINAGTALTSGEEFLMQVELEHALRSQPDLAARATRENILQQPRLQQTRWYFRHAYPSRNTIQAVNRWHRPQDTWNFF